MQNKYTQTPPVPVHAQGTRLTPSKGTGPLVHTSRCRSMGLTQLHEEEEQWFQERWSPGTGQTGRASVRMKLAIPQARVSLPAACPGKSNCGNMAPAMKATGKGTPILLDPQLSCSSPHRPVLRTQLPDQQFVRTWNQARDQGGPVGCRHWVSATHSSRF